MELKFLNIWWISIRAQLNNNYTLKYKTFISVVRMSYSSFYRVREIATTEILGI